jgi:signal recognition particle subunit SRP54
MKQMQKLGPLQEILKMIPGMGCQMEGIKLSGDELHQMEAIIQSMTQAERENPELIEASRRRRIARGSGCEVEDVSGLVKSFTQAAAMMKQMAGMGMRDRMAFAKNMTQQGMFGMPKFKVKQRSHRLTKKEREKLKKKKKR